MRTEYEFILPRGYLDEDGVVHRRGTMRLATARDELEPLRDPTINSADDPRLTIVVLARVVQTLGTMRMVTAHEIEGLFAADLAYLQDFYGVINFGSEDDIESLLEAQQELLKPPAPRQPVTPAPFPVPAGEAATAPGDGGGGAERPAGRRSAIEEVPASGR